MRQTWRRPENGRLRDHADVVQEMAAVLKPLARAVWGANLARLEAEAQEDLEALTLANQRLRERLSSARAEFGGTFEPFQESGDPRIRALLVEDCGPEVVTGCYAVGLAFTDVWREANEGAHVSRRYLHRIFPGFAHRTLREATAMGRLEAQYELLGAGSRRPAQRSAAWEAMMSGLANPMELIARPPVAFRLRRAPQIVPGRPPVYPELHGLSSPTASLAAGPPPRTTSPTSPGAR